jgi:hypothetical protein
VPDSLDALPADHPIHNPAHWWQALTDIRTLLSRINTRASRAVDLRRYVDEYAQSDSASMLQIRPTTSDAVLVKSIFFGLPPTGSNGLLTVGDRKIPFTCSNSGPVLITPLSLVLRGQTDITLTCTATGPIFLEVMGIELPVTTL